MLSSSHPEIAKAVTNSEFAGFTVGHDTEPLFRRVLAIGAFSCWQMIGFAGQKNVQNLVLAQEDAQSIYYAFRQSGFLQALDALVCEEHSWGWVFEDLDLLEELVTLVQSRIADAAIIPHDPRAWGALNLFKLFLADKDSVNVRLTDIPCVCSRCIRRNPWHFIRNIHSIIQSRMRVREILCTQISDDLVAGMYERVTSS